MTSSSKLPLLLLDLSPILADPADLAHAHDVHLVHLDLIPPEAATLCSGASGAATPSQWHTKRPPLSWTST